MGTINSLLQTNTNTLDSKIYKYNSLGRYGPFVEYPGELLRDLNTEKFFRGSLPVWNYYTCAEPNKEIIKKYINAGLAVKLLGCSINGRYHTVSLSRCDGKDPIENEKYALLYVDNDTMDKTMRNVIQTESRAFDERKKMYMEHIGMIVV